MKKEIYIIGKEEAYTFDELDIITKALMTSPLEENQKQEEIKKLETLKNAIANNRTDMAIFFMPQQTFSIFSLFQGNNSLCNFQLSDAKNLAIALDGFQNKNLTELKKHLAKKINTLCEYLQLNNTIQPVAIQANMLTKKQIDL